jgi:hypothetical protein
MRETDIVHGRVASPWTDRRALRWTLLRGAFLCSPFSSADFPPSCCGAALPTVTRWRYVHAIDPGGISMKRLITGLIALAILALGTVAASAQAGSPAWSLKPLVLLEGPGHAYDVTGEIGEFERIYVDRCSKLWCRVHADGEAGWTKLYAITFGHLPRMTYKSGGPGIVCLYEGSNYTGESICGKPGTTIRDLLLLDLDNRYSSVTVEGDVSVMLCRDRDFHSYCERIQGSENLHGFLNNNVSSVRVY